MKIFSVFKNKNIKSEDNVKNDWVSFPSKDGIEDIYLNVYVSNDKEIFSLYPHLNIIIVDFKDKIFDVKKFIDDEQLDIKIIGNKIYKSKEKVYFQSKSEEDVQKLLTSLSKNFDDIELDSRIIINNESNYYYQFLYPNRKQFELDKINNVIKNIEDEYKNKDKKVYFHVIIEEDKNLEEILNNKEFLDKFDSYVEKKIRSKKMLILEKTLNFNLMEISKYVNDIIDYVELDNLGYYEKIEVL